MNGFLQSIVSTWRWISGIVFLLVAGHIAAGVFLYFYAGQFLPKDADAQDRYDGFLSSDLELALIRRVDSDSGEVVNVIEGRRTAVLTDDWLFCDQKNEVIIRVMQKYKVDFASIPFYARLFLRPFGTYTEAAVLHDWLYSVGEPGKRLEADLYFYEAMRQEKTHPWVRRIVFGAVRLGGGGSYGTPSEWHTRFYERELNADLSSACSPPKPTTAKFSLRDLREDQRQDIAIIKGEDNIDEYSVLLPSSGSNFCPISARDATGRDVADRLSSDFEWSKVYARPACTVEVMLRQRNELTREYEINGESSRLRPLIPFVTDRLSANVRHAECYSPLSLLNQMSRQEYVFVNRSKLFPEPGFVTREELLYESHYAGLDRQAFVDYCSSRTIESISPQFTLGNRLALQRTTTFGLSRIRSNFDLIVSPDTPAQQKQQIIRADFSSVALAYAGLCEADLPRASQYIRSAFTNFWTRTGAPPKQRQLAEHWVDLFIGELSALREQGELVYQSDRAEHLQREALENPELMLDALAAIIASQRPAECPAGYYRRFGNLESAIRENLFLTEFVQLADAAKLRATVACENNASIEDLMSTAPIGFIADHYRSGSDEEVRLWTEDTWEEARQTHAEFQSMDIPGSADELQTLRHQMEFPKRKLFDYFLKNRASCNAE